MLFFHMLLSNFDSGATHPYRDTLIHWLACFACTVAFWLAVGFVAFLTALALGIAVGN